MGGRGSGSRMSASTSRDGGESYFMTDQRNMEDYAVAVGMFDRDYLRTMEGRQALREFMDGEIEEGLTESQMRQAIRDVGTNSGSSSGASLGKSPSEAVSGFFTDTSRRHWAGTVSAGRASAVNIAEVYGDDHGTASGRGNKGAADRDIREVATHIVAANVPRDQLKGSSNLQYGPMANDPRATLGDAGFDALRSAIIDEAVRYSNGNTRARRDYRSTYGRR